MFSAAISKALRRIPHARLFVALVVGTHHASGCDVARDACPQSHRDNAGRLLEIVNASPAFALLRGAW